MPKDTTALSLRAATMQSISGNPTFASIAELSLWRSARLQLRVLWALLLRETLTRYGRHNLGFLWLFAEPMFFTLGVTAILSAMGSDKHGIPVAAFVVTGYSTLLLWRNMPNRCVDALTPNAPLLYHRQVKPLDVYLTRCLLEAIGATMSFFVLSVIFIEVGLASPPKDMLKVATGWLMLVWYGLAISLLIGALSERSRVVEKLWHPVQYFMIPLSGAFFMLAWMPEKVRNILLYVPTINCVELLREGYFGPPHYFYYDMSYVAVFNLLVLLLALIQIRHVSRTFAPNV